MSRANAQMFSRQVVTCVCVAAEKDGGRRANETPSLLFHKEWTPNKSSVGWVSGIIMCSYMFILRLSPVYGAISVQSMTPRAVGKICWYIRSLCSEEPSPITCKRMTKKPEFSARVLSWSTHRFRRVEVVECWVSTLLSLISRTMKI